jgi:hypothetical protein
MFNKEVLSGHVVEGGSLIDLMLAVRSEYTVEEQRLGGEVWRQIKIIPCLQSHPSESRSTITVLMLLQSILVEFPKAR